MVWCCVKMNYFLSEWPDFDWKRPNFQLKSYFYIKNDFIWKLNFRICAEFVNSSIENGFILSKNGQYYGLVKIWLFGYI